MYETLMQTLRTCFGSGALRVSLIVAITLIVFSLAAHASSVFRQQFRRWRESHGWRGSLSGLWSAVFKTLVVFVLARVLIVAMVYQSNLFERQHGRITDRNRSAVLMKWGGPHEQQELGVSHTKKRIWITRQLRLEDEKQTIVSESFWKDENRPVEAVGGKLPTVISTREEVREIPVEQRSIVSADVTVVLRSNPRRLGNANYAGYDDEWKLAYVVANHDSEATVAHLNFALPAETGLFDGMYLRVDGTNILDTVKSEGSALSWEMPMAVGEKKTVELGYRSRGLEHLRYIPKRMSQTGHYRVAVTIAGISPAKLDYPIGSMPPAENLQSIKSVPYTLTWNLDNALTSYDIGIKLPVAEQPAYYFATLLREAPVGLILLLILLVAPRLAAGEPVRLDTVGILAAAYYLVFTFMGRLADLMTGFSGPFAIAAALLTAVIVWFRMRDSESLLLRTQDTLAFSAMAILYPLSVVDGDRTAFWMQLFYISILVYVCALLVHRRLAVLPDKLQD